MEDRFFSRENFLELCDFYKYEWNNRNEIYHGGRICNALNALVTIALAPVDVLELLTTDVLDGIENVRRQEEMSRR